MAHSDAQPKRVLIVTECIQTGGSLVPLTEALRYRNLPYDIAAVALDPLDYTPEQFMKQASMRLHSRIAYGMKGEPALYMRHDVAGVEKEAHNLFSHRHRGGSTADKDKTARDLDIAREDVNTLAKQLAELYRSGDSSLGS